MISRVIISVILPYFTLLETSKAAEPVCSSNFEHYDGVGCLFFNGDGRGYTWQEAKDNCELFGGFLAEARDDITAALFLGVAQSTGQDFWLGASRTSVAEPFVWDHSGLEVGFTPWGVGEPAGTGGCLASTKEHLYFWSEADCNQRFQPICQAPTLVTKCPGSLWNLDLFLNRCYLYEETEEMTYDEAVAYCQSYGDGVYLAELTTATEQQSMRSILQSFGVNSNMWIGLSDRDEEGTYVWENSGELATAVDWFPGQPDGQAQPLQDCVYMGFGSNQFFWFDAECDTSFRPLCESDPIGL